MQTQLCNFYSKWEVRGFPAEWHSYIIVLIFLVHHCRCHYILMFWEYLDGNSRQHSIWRNKYDKQMRHTGCPMVYFVIIDRLCEPWHAWQSSWYFELIAVERHHPIIMIQVDCRFVIVLHMHSLTKAVISFIEGTFITSITFKQII